MHNANAGAQGLLLKTQDGGFTWTARRVDTEGVPYAQSLRAIRFADADNAILLGVRLPSCVGVCVCVCVCVSCHNPYTHTYTRARARTRAHTHTLHVQGCNEWMRSSDAGRTWVFVNLSDVDAGLSFRA
jgi:photosystem II stability/assembly factor-like uncharacterized protein